jgi:hypothetical protein
LRIFIAILEVVFTMDLKSIEVLTLGICRGSAGQEAMEGTLEIIFAVEMIANDFLCFRVYLLCFAYFSSRFDFKVPL